MPLVEVSMRRSARIGLLAVFTVAVVGGLAYSAWDSVAPRLLAAYWHLDIDRAMDIIGVKPGMVVGEAGAGDGYFTLPMARRVGALGVVYANDISKRSLDSLADQARRETLSNVHIVEGAIDDPLFPRRDLQLLVIVHAFHDFSQPVEWLINARKYLAPGGVVAIIDRDPSQGAEHHFWPRDRILGYADKAGFEKVTLVDTVSQHLIIVLKPKPGA
jgi:ubiquinone/menaquinone biosynthesis C-methylase UbiE